MNFPKTGRSNSHIILEQQTNILESVAPMRKSEAVEVLHESGQSSEEEFLDKVENILCQSHRKKISNEEILLQAQVVQLQNKCNSLAVSNQQLLEKLNLPVETEQKSKRSEKKKMEEFEDTSFSSSCEDISEIQQQLSELQEFVLSFRSQLLMYQRKINHQIKFSEDKMDQLQKTIDSNEMKLHQVQKALKNQKLNNYALIRKNEQLVMELEQQKEKNLQFFNQSLSKLDNSYGTQFQLQMQRIVEKLANELEYERNMKKKFHMEMKTLTKELSESEKKIQKKNETIYNLEMKLLRGEKKNMCDDRGIRHSGRRMGNESPGQSIIQSHNTSESMSPITYNFTKPERKENKFISFTLDAVLRKQVRLKQWSILLICSKIIDLYEEETKKKQMLSGMPSSSICVYNFNQNYQSLLRVKFMNDGRNCISKDSFFQQIMMIIKSLLQLMLSQTKNKQFVNSLLEQLSKRMQENNPTQVKALKHMIEELVVLEEAADSSHKKSIRYQ